jgi:hypothetical protein
MTLPRICRFGIRFGLPQCTGRNHPETFHVIAVHVEFGFERRSCRVSVAYVGVVLDPLGLLKRVG